MCHHLLFVWNSTTAILCLAAAVVALIKITITHGRHDMMCTEHAAGIDSIYVTVAVILRWCHCILEARPLLTTVSCKQSLPILD